MPDLTGLFSANAKNLKPSAVSGLLSLTQKPEIISFAGGLPSPDVFPVEDLKTAAIAVFDGQARRALQYGRTEGDNALRDELIKFEAKQGISVEDKNLLVVSASQQGLDLVGKVFLDPGDYVIAERPSFIGALLVLQSYSAKVLGIELTREQDGFDMAVLERKYSEARKQGKKLKYIYVVPDFQNPAGFCWSLENRKALLEFAYKTGLPIVEDSPYREIRFMGSPIPSLYQLDQEGANKGIVISLKTFSKMLAPGVRLGWIIANEEVIPKFALAKLAMDTCSSVFTQCWLAEYMRMGKLDTVLEKARKLYCEKRNLMMTALDSYMPKHPDIRWTKPEGGLFLWLSLPKSMDTDELLLSALEKKVAFMAGSGFYFDEVEHNSMRINFSYPSPGQIDEGIKRLGNIIEEAL